MWKRNRIIGLVCAVAMSVYSGRVIPPDAATSNDHSDTGRVPFQRSRLTIPTDTAILAEAITPADASEGPQADSTPPDSAHAGVSMTSNQVTVSDAGTIEMHVSDAGLLEVLRMLSLKSRKNIIASKSVDGRVTANLYNVTIREALDAILQSNGYVYREKGNFIYVYSAKELADLDKASRTMGTEVFHLYYTPAANAASMIKPVLSPEAQVAVTTAAQSGIDLAITGDTVEIRMRPKTCWSSPTLPKTLKRPAKSSRKWTAARRKFWSKRPSWRPR